MIKLGRGTEILREEGFQSLIGRSVNYYSRIFWNDYYKYKSIIFDDYMISIDGVKINTNHEGISDEMLKRLRSREYEQDTGSMLKSYLYSNLPVIELGGGIGYTSCLADAICDDSVNIITVEANKNLTPLIEETRHINNSNFNICNKAYSANKEELDLMLAADFWSSSQYDRDMSNKYQVSVSATNIKELTRNFDLAGEFQLIVDIEGGEHDLIVNEMDVLRSNCKLLIVEFHSFTEYDLGEYRQRLEDNGFKCLDSTGVESPGPDSVFVFENRELD